MAESPVRSWRPLEPDAGNAAEGSEGPIAGLAMAAMRATKRMAFLFNHQWSDWDERLRR